MKIFISEKLPHVNPEKILITKLQIEAFICEKGWLMIYEDRGNTGDLSQGVELKPLQCDENFWLKLFWSIFLSLLLFGVFLCSSSFGHFLQKIFIFICLGTFVLGFTWCIACGKFEMSPLELKERKRRKKLEKK